MKGWKGSMTRMPKRPGKKGRARKKTCQEPQAWGTNMSEGET